ncbi:MAG: glycosyltransferase [Mucispirillum sp.]|nr:glycosyltransferase [Mucispirillum sp.]
MSNDKHTNYESFYNAEYYKSGCGEDYNKKDFWRPFYQNIANKIIELFNPKTVLDIGCAYGYIVEALREKGVDAYGIDVSSYAISQANEKIKPYLKAMSALDDLPDNFPKKYDLVISIEMIEHLYEEDGLKAIDKMVNYSDKILISSTDSDFDEPTHFNVQPQEYWSEKFAAKGYIRNLISDFSFISLHTYYFIKKDSIGIPKLVNDYERCIRILTKKYCKEQETSGKLNNDINEVRKLWADDKAYYKNEISALNKEIESYREQQDQWNKDKTYYENKISDYVSLQNQWNKDREYYENRINDYISLQDQWNKDKEYYENRISDYVSLQEQWNKDTAYYKDKISDYKSLQEQWNNLEKSYKIKIFNLEKSAKELKLNINQLENSINLTINEKNTEIHEKNIALEQINELNNILNELNNLSTEQGNIIKYNEYLLETIYCSRGYKFLRKFYRIRDWLLPVNSYRRKFFKKIINIFIKKNVNEVTNSTETEIVNNTMETVNDVIDTVNNAMETVENNCNIHNHIQYSEHEIARQDYFINNPIDEKIKFSIIVPAYQTEEKIFREMIESVIGQIYKNWELCIVNASPEYEYIEETVESYKDNRIKFKNLEKNGGIAENTKEALKIVTGDFICLLDHDDLIAPNALSEFALKLKDNPNIDFFYTDKDMIDANAENRMNPLVKPEYSPELMYSANYFTHFCVIRKTIMDTIKISKETDGSQDWDIFLQVMEKTSNIVHIPEKLYHWRIIPTSVASGIGAKPYALNAQLLSINNHFKRTGLPCSVDFDDDIKARIRVKWDIPDDYNIHLVVLFTNNVDIKLDNERYNITYIEKNDEKINEIIDNISCDALVFIDADEILSISNEDIDEIASWTVHPDIAFIFPVYTRNNVVKSTGLVYRDSKIYDFYPNKPYGFYGNMGSCFWYRNLSLGRGITTAIAKNKWDISKKYKKEYGSLALVHNAIYLLQKGFRNLYDPFAYVEVSWQFNNIHYINNDFMYIREEYNLIEKDPYLSNYAQVDIEDDSANAQISIPQDKYTQDAFALSYYNDFSLEDLEKNKICLKNGENSTVKSIIWFLPEFDYVFYAGLYTIFRTAQYLQDHYNIENAFAFLSSKSTEDMMSKVGEGFPELMICSAYQIRGFQDLESIPEYNASVSTLWTTAYYSLKFNKVKRKFYFIQDYESLFYPGGSTFAQAEVTYTFGFEGIVNTKGLADVYRKDYNGEAVTLNPSVDRTIFYPPSDRQYEKKIYTVFFYGRPGHPRNGFELGVNAMIKLKEIMGDNVRIVTAGANYKLSDYGLDGIVENLGRLQIEETGNLYRNCDAGLVMMYTRHPSYLPYELMACGCCVVSNYNMYTTWLLKNEENSIVCQPSATAIAESIVNILKDKEKRKEITENALYWIDKENPTWDESLEKVAKFVTEN